jgi:hypothetical protein
MTTKPENKSNRGGKRPGAGRPRQARSINWNGIAARFFQTSDPIGEICAAFGIAEQDLLAHAKRHGWVRRPEKQHPEDVGRLASSLALAMISVDGVAKRAKCFVAAMVKLEAPIIEIAEALEASESAVRAEFASELRAY